MTPGNYTLVVPVGTTLRQQFSWAAAGVAVDLTDWTGRLVVERVPFDVRALLEATTENGGLALTADGVILLDVDVANSLREADVTWRLDLIDPLGDVTRLLAGEAIVTAGVPA